MVTKSSLENLLLQKVNSAFCNYHYKKQSFTIIMKYKRHRMGLQNSKFTVITSKIAELTIRITKAEFGITMT